MARTTTDPIEILLEMGVDLDNLSEEEDYLSALMEAVNILTIKNASDPRIKFLADEIRKVRQKRKAADSKFKAKKTKVSANSFKKGSATTSRVGQRALPSAIKPKTSIIPYQKPDEVDDEEEGGKKKKRQRQRKPKEKNLLAEIAKSVTNIADILKDQYKLKKKEGEFDRKKAQRDKRKLQEAGLEKRFKTLFNTAQKIIAPVRSLFDKILGFLFNVLLAKFLTKVVNWIANPKNQKKIQSIIRFFKDHWKKLLSLYIVFGTGLGKFVLGLSKLLITGAVKLGIAIAKLAAAKGIGGARRLASMLGGKKARRIINAGATALTVGGTLMGVNALTSDGGQQTQGFSGGGLASPPKKPNGMGGRPGSFRLPPGMEMIGGGGGTNAITGQAKSRSLMSILSDPFGIKLRKKQFNDPQFYLTDEEYKNREESGQVEGPGGTDKVPAMLTAGEFVMSRGAVQKFGVKQLEAMNAAGGGTNKPKVVDNTVYASVGGYIEDIANLIGLGKKGTPDPPKENKSQPPTPNYSSGSFASDPLGALDRILGQGSGGRFRLPGMGSESPTPPPPKSDPPKSNPQPQPNRPPKSKPDSKPKEPLIPGKADPPPPEEPGIPEKMLKSPTFRDSGLLYLRHLMGGLGGAVTEQDLSKETKHELNLAIARAKKRHAGNLAKATREWEEAKKGGWNKSSSKEGRDAYATRKSQYERLKAGQIQVLYQDYYDGNDEKNITESAEDSKSVLGQFWAQQTKDGGYRIVNEKYDFQPMNDPYAVLMGDSRGIAKNAKDGKPDQEITLRNKLQALAQLNPFTKDMTVDMILGQPETAERQTNNILRKMGGFLDFVMRDTTDFDAQGIKASSEAKGDKGVPFPTRPETPLLPKNTQEKLDAKPKLTAQQIKNNQAYAASKGKYYSSTTGKTYASYAEALKDPAVAAGANQMQQKKQSTMNMIMGGKDAYYSSTTGQYYKNYAQALKDPRVKAAAEVEKTKKRLSFAPQNPNVSTPEQPPANNIQIINVGGDQQQQNKSNNDRDGSQTPQVNAGSGDQGKFKIFGIPMPF